MGSPASSKAIAGTEGAIPALVAHLTFVTREHGTPPHWSAMKIDFERVRLLAVGAFSGLFTSDLADAEHNTSLARAFFADGAVTPLIAALGSGASLTEAALKGLSLILKHGRDVAISSLVGKNASKVVDVVRRGGPEASEGFILLSTLIDRAPDCRGAVLEAGAMPLLIGLLRDGGRHVCMAASVLRGLCENDPPVVKAAVDSGALELLTALLRSEDRSCRRSVISPLTALLGAATWEHKERAMAGGVASLLADCFFEFDAPDDLHLVKLSGFALKYLFPADPVLLASLVDQIMHGSTRPSRLVEMLGGEETLSFVTLSLMADILRSPAHLPTLVSAGLPRALVAMLNSAHGRQPAVIAAGARVLLSLTPSGASVGEEVAAAGFDAARLRQLAGLGDEGGCPAPA